MNFLHSEKRKRLILFFSLLLYAPQAAFCVIIPDYISSAAFFTQTGINLLHLLFFCLYALFGSRRLLSGIISVWLPVVIVWNITDLLLYLNLGTYFNYECFQLMKHTNFNEAAGSMVLFFLNWSTFLLLLTYPWAGLFLLLPIKRFTAGVISALVFVCGIAAAAFLASPDSFETIPNPVQRIEKWMFTHIQASFQTNLDAVNKNIQAVNNEKRAVYILVLGESHSRAHSSLYGYPRKNMPLLENRKNEKGFFYFWDVVSPHSVTLMVLPKLLSFEAHNSEKNFHNSHTLTDIFRKAGFKTFYFTTQPENKWYLKIAQRTHVYKFAKRSGKAAWDEDLIELFKNILTEDTAPKKFIILHLSGSHFPYDLRYPPEFRYFAPDAKESSFNEEQIRNCKKINSYDNSLRYTDFILDKLFELVKNSGENSFVVYLSDHGEALWENGISFGHSEFIPLRQTVEIPFLLYFSPEYMRNMSPDSLKEISKAVDRPWNSEDLPYLLIDLARINYQGFDPQRSLINPMFKKRERIISAKGTSYEELKKASNTSFSL